MNDYAMIRHNVEPNTDAWLELRKKYRTASEAPIVAGISPFTTPSDFKLIKAGLKKQFYSAAMRRGHELEAQVRQHASDHFDLDFVEAIFTRGGYLASLDGYANDTVLEIKVSDYTFNELEEGKVPEHYHLQIQQQMYCSGATSAYLYAYSPKRDEYIKSYEIAPMDGFKERMDALWDAFDAMPIPDGPLDLSDDGEVQRLFSQYAYLKAESDNLKEQMDSIKEQLLERAHHRSMTAGDYKLTRKEGAKRTDYKKACSDAKLDVSGYTTQGEPTYAISLPKNPFA